MPIGTLINALTVVIGCTIGITLRQNFPEKIKQIVFQGLGLASLLIGIQMALKGDNILLIIFSLLIGGILGQAVDLELRLEQIGDKVKKLLHSDNTVFTEGLITAFLLFCIGPLTILGAFNEGLRGDHTLLFTKALLDGFSSIALSATFGSGVLVSIIPLLIYQITLTLAAGALKGIFTPHIIAGFTAIGGLLVVGIAINLLEIRKIRVANFLPALVIVILLSLIIK